MRLRSLAPAILGLAILVTPCAARAQQAGQITYRLGNEVFRVAAQEGATPENVSRALDAVAPGSDAWLSISPDAAWLLLSTTRFDPECVGSACLTILTADLQIREVVRPGGELIHPEGLGAVASGGSLIVYEAGGGPHTLDLWAVSRSGSGWSTPVLLTGASPHPFNQLPAISADGSKVLFDCGAEPFGGFGTSICEVGTTGTGFRVVLTPADSPPGLPDTGALHSPRYAPDGSIVFEADWDGERIWRLPPGATVPVKITNEFPNDNTPCVLPDGRIVSLWLGRPGGLSFHELKVMTPDGSGFFMVVTEVDVADIGLGCGGAAARPDILLVIDNSGSMAEEQAKLAASAGLFLDALLATGADFHLAVVSTDMANPGESGRFLARPGNPTILTQQTPNVQSVFAENVQLGTLGDGFEKGLQAMEAALSPPLIDAENRGFLRPDASLVVVFVSDEEDCSHEPGVIPEFDGDECVRNLSRMIPVQHYVDFLTRLKGGDPSRVFVAAITGPDVPRDPPPLLCSADAECLSGRCSDGRCCPPDPILPLCFADAQCADLPGTSCTGQKCLPLPLETGRPYAPRECSCFTPDTGLAEPGTRYIDLVRAFGGTGLYASICAPDWGGTLKMLATLAVEGGLPPGPPPPPPPPPGPPLSVDAGGPYFGFEGSPIAFHGSVSSPGGGALEVLWDFGDGTTAAELEPTHVYADNGSFPCQLTVTDGLQSAGSVCQVEVENVIPVVAPLPGATLLEGDTYAATGSFTDPGADVWVATVDYGDGYGVQRLALSQKTFQLSHLYFTAGTYTVTVSVTDDDSRTPGIGQASIVVLTPRRAIVALSGLLDGLVASGGLEHGNAKSLKAKLEAALQQLERGNVGAATNQLEAFLHEAEALEKAGRLAPGDARRLTDDAGRIIRRINHVDPPPVCACPAAPIVARPLETVTLSAAVCSDPEGEPLRFAWTLEQSPAGSTSALAGADPPDASLFLDVATTPETPYVARVTVTDPPGQSASCAYTILAVPSARLHLQLVWDTDRTDLDLHLLDGIGTEDRFGPSGWFNTVNDCFSLNRSPDWGTVRDRTDNPRLDIEDFDGFGPENINLDAPAATTYTVGVHYFCDGRLGVSRAAVRVFCDGVLAGEFTSPLAATGAFWEVAEVTFPGCAVRPLGLTTTVRQGCPAGPVTCDGLTALSSVVLGHSHILCVPAADLANPPAEGRLYLTSSSAGHTHTVILSQADLQMIQSGQSVFVSTSVVEGHTHDFVIFRDIPATGLTCHILTPPLPLREGQALTFVAVAKNLNGAIVPGQSFTWSSDNPSAVEIDDNGVATGGSTTGVANITCQVVGGSTVPSAPVAVHNYANVEAGMVRAVVVDERTGAPLAGASVLFEPAGTVVTTNGNGIAQVAATGPVNVHAFHAGYTWMSIVGTSANDILLPMSPTPDGTRAGGFKGEFDLSLVPNPQDEVVFGLAGASLPGSFLDLDFEKVIGGNYRRRVRIGSLFDDFLFLPSGLVLKIGDTAIQGEYRALAEPGLRHGWGLGGKIPFDQLLAVLTPILGDPDPGTVNLGQIIVPILRFFENFLHFVRTDIAVTEVPKVPDLSDINGDGSTTDLVPDFDNPVGFPTVTARVNQPLTLSTSLTVPPLPHYDNRPLESVLILPGASVTGRGLVPLGLSAAVDAPAPGEAPDGLVDVDPATPGNQSTVSFKMSPLHEGLEGFLPVLPGPGSRFFFATLATSLAFGSGVPTSVSGIITQTDRVDTTTPLGVSSFLGFPETASFNLTARAFDLGVPFVAGATFHRADFRGPDGDWVVYFKAPLPGAPAFVLPTPPVGADRAVLTCATSDGGTRPCTALRVITLATTAGPLALDLDAISAFGTVNFTRLNDFLSAFSSEGCQDNGDCAPPATP